MRYNHLSLEERHYIELRHKAGQTMSEIAKALTRSQPTISREINRNSGRRGYRYQQADKFAVERHKTKPKHIKMTDKMKRLITDYIEIDWSPEQIVDTLKQGNVIELHLETIYRFILEDKQAGGQLYKHLRHQNKTYRKRYGAAHNRHGIPNRVDIDERPEQANNRERVGDFEGDTIIGKNHKGAIVTLDDRKTKIRFALPVNNKTAQAVTDAITFLLQPIKKHLKTLTFDNGKEFAKHVDIATSLDCDVYFAKPYHSWERGQNENANGLLRQYFPKSMELIDISMESVFDAVDSLNSRPRKCLGFKTPYQFFEELTGLDMRKIMGYALIT